MQAGDNMAHKLPIVTIVGRQNTGKSTLFNAVIKEKKAIVDEYPGLTRDILRFPVNYGGKSFILSDTPGLDLPSTAELSKSILDNAADYLKQSDVIIFLMEYPAPEKYDDNLASMIRKLNLPVIVAVNKMDSNTRLENMPAFYETGFKEILPISALNKKNIPLLMDLVVELLPRGASALREPDVSVAIIGRPNSGKSTLLNALAGAERAIVSDIPGTTRDAVDDFFLFHGKLIRLIDTAGLRRKSKSAEGIEFYSFKRTIASIKKCDVAIHLIDAEQGISETDKKISDLIIDDGAPVILAVNKWDLLEKNHKTFEEFKDRMLFKFYKTGDFPVISISAKDKLRINKLMQLVLDLKERASVRIDTPVLNNVVGRLQGSGRLPQTGDKLKVYYAVQTGTVPPVFKFFVNKPTLFKKDIIRYFEKGLQKEFNLKGVPTIIQIEGRRNAEEESKSAGKTKPQAKNKTRGKIR